MRRLLDELDNYALMYHELKRGQRETVVLQEKARWDGYL